MLVLTKVLNDFELLCSAIFEFPDIQINLLNEAHWLIRYMQNVRTKLRLDLKCFLISRFTSTYTMKPKVTMACTFLFQENATIIY